MKNLPFKVIRSREPVGFLINRHSLTRSQCSRTMYKNLSQTRYSSGNGLTEVLERLQDCGWYWGPMDSDEATAKLKLTSCGTFLLRDSTDSRHLFTLSVRTTLGMTSVRVLYRHGRFTLDSVEPDWQKTPNFDCVIKLIYYYLRVSNNRDGRRVFARLENAEDGEEMPLVLNKPLFQGVASLKHLCRRVINAEQHPENVVHMKLQPGLEKYLLNYPYPI